jgi:hypothetical protein
MARMLLAAMAATAAVACGQQSEGSFPNVYRDARSAHLGPLALSGLRDIATMDRSLLERLGGFKAPLVLRPGRSVTIATERDVARISYGGDAGREFDAAPAKVRFRACTRRRSQSHAGSQKVTFWPGAFVLKPDATCLRLRITIDGRSYRRAFRVASPSSTSAECRA